MKYFILIVVLCVLNLTSQAQILQEADQLYQTKDWKRAVVVYEQLTKANPYNGKFWYRLGDIYRQLNQLDQSTQAYEKAVEVGHLAGFAMYNIACNYSLQKKPKEAVAWLERAIPLKKAFEPGQLLTDTDFDPIRNLPEFQKLLPPQIPADISRDKGWEQDIDYLDRELRRTHYNLFHTLSETQWQQAIRQLKSSIPHLDDTKLTIELMKLVASVGDGHTVVLPPHHGKFQFHQLPVVFTEFKEGMFIRALPKEYRQAVGGQVLKIGKTEVGALKQQLITLLPMDKGNAESFKFIGMFYLSSAEVLQAFGAIGKPDEVDITYRTAQGKIETILVKSEPFDFGSPVLSGNTQAYVNANEKAPNPVPLYLKNPDEVFWFEYLPSQKIVYAQINQIRDKGNVTLGMFGKQVREFINQNDVEALVLDIRNNNGGNNFLNQPLIHELIRCEKINQKGKFFAIIGPRTFSAAMNLAADLERHLPTIFVGMPTGSSPNHIGDNTFFNLPYSGLMVSGSSAYWQARTSYDFRKWIAPDLLAEPTFEAYSRNEDIAMQTILDYLKK